MADGNRDIQSLSNFKRHTPDFLRQLKETGEPVLLTIKGKSELVAQDAASYQRLLALADRWESYEAVKEGLASVARGEGRPTRSSRRSRRSFARRSGHDVPVVRLPLALLDIFNLDVFDVDNGNTIKS